MEEVRYELNHEGKIVEGNAELSSNIEGILTDVFSQYNNTCLLYTSDAADE